MLEVGSDWEATYKGQSEVGIATVDSSVEREARSRSGERPELRNFFGAMIFSSYCVNSHADIMAIQFD